MRRITQTVVLHAEEGKGHSKQKGQQQQMTDVELKRSWSEEQKDPIDPQSATNEER